MVEEASLMKMGEGNLLSRENGMERPRVASQCGKCQEQLEGQDGFAAVGMEEGAVRDE